MHVLCQQMFVIGEVMAGVLRSPPQAGQNITEWAKQQACRKRALETPVPEVAEFRARLVGAEEQRAVRKSAREDGRVDRAVQAITEVMQKDAQYWQGHRSYARQKKLSSLKMSAPWFPRSICRRWCQAIERRNDCFHF